MERLTKRSRGLALHHECFDVCGTCTGAPCPYIQPMVDRLAAYEDTGLEPEDIISAVDMARVACALHKLNAYTDLGTIDHLRELVQAEQDGRLVVLPCKVGDTVYRVLTTRDCPPVLSEAKIETVGQAADLIRVLGKHKLLSCYLTREEAEAALKGGAE